MGFLAGPGAFGLVGGPGWGAVWDYVLIWPVVFVLWRGLRFGVIRALDGVCPLFKMCYFIQFLLILKQQQIPLKCRLVEGCQYPILFWQYLVNTRSIYSATTPFRCYNFNRTKRGGKRFQPACYCHICLM